MAPPMSAQLPPPALQRRHWYARESGAGDQVAAERVSTSPTFAVPVIDTGPVFVSVPGFVVKDALVPDWLPPEVLVAVTVVEPVEPRVRLCEASTPFENVAVVPPPAVSVPLELMSTVLPAPLNAVTVLPWTSRAVTRTEKGTPTVCVPMAPPPAASTRKLLSGPGVIVIDGDEPRFVKAPPALERCSPCQVATPTPVGAVAPGPPPAPEPYRIVSVPPPARVTPVTVITWPATPTLPVLAVV